MKRIVTYLKRKKNSIIHASKGVISIFLAILMLPFVTIAGALINAARINSALAIFEEAMSNSADSTLANYDTFLKNRFGLLGMKQEYASDGDHVSKAVENIYGSYLNNNLLSLNNTFFNLNNTTKGMYPLADTNILLYQILEYSKYAVPTKLASDGISNILNSLESALPFSNWMDVISDGSNFGTACIEAGQAKDELVIAVGETTTAFNYFDSSYSTFESKVSDLSSKKSAVESAQSKVNEKTTALTNAENNYNARYQEISGQISSNVSGLNNELTKWTDWSNKLKELRGDNDPKVEKIGYKWLSDDYARTKAFREDTNNSAFINLNGISLNRNIDDLINDASSKILEINTQLNNTGSEINNNSELSELSQRKNTAQSELTSAQNELASAQSQIQGAIDAAKTARSTYSSDISELISKLNNEKSKISNYNGKVEAMKENLTNMGGSIFNALTEEEKKDIKDEISDLKEEQSAWEDYYNYGKHEFKDKETGEKRTEYKTVDHDTYISQRNALEKEIQSRNDAITGKSNEEEMAKVVKNQINDGISSSNTILGKFNDFYYETLIIALTNLKNKVDNWSDESVTSSFNSADFKNNYYYMVGDKLTEEKVNEAEKELMKSVANESVIGFVKQIIQMLEVILEILEVFDPKLNSIVDTKSYVSTYSWDAIERGNTADKALSEYYKELYGSLDATDLSANDSLSLGEIISDIFTNLSTIKSKFEIQNLFSTLISFGETVNEINACIDNIKQDFSDVVEWFKGIAENMLMKFLLVGYLSYVTSDRTTYESGRSITGASFNLRGQNSNWQDDFGSLSIGKLVEMLTHLFSGEEARSFVGAETEYLINGSEREIANQMWTFLWIYLIRLVCDILPIVKSNEVRTLASSVGWFGIIVYILYILLEPFLDTLLLVHGGSVPLIKNAPYLTVSGVPKFISSATGIALSSDVQNKIGNFVNDATHMQGNTTQADVDPSSIGSISIGNMSLGDLKYKHYTILCLLLVDTDVLLERFRDIIQMEALQNANKGTREGQADVYFNLGNSFTYIRAESTFTTNEFVSVSGTGFTPKKKRLIYRGY